MILYHAVSIYQLLECLVHRTIYHKNEKAIFLTMDFMQRRLGERYGLLKEFFYEILIYGNQDTACVDELAGNGYALSDFTKIYVACAHGWFGIYLCEHHIPFIFMEDGVGAISQPEILIKVQHPGIRTEKGIEYGLFSGENENIVKCICNMKHQRDGYTNVKAEHFDVIEELNILGNKTQIIAVFTDLKEIKLDKEKKNVVFLTEHLANLGVLEWEEQIYLYQIVLDYYFQDVNLIIKPHPDDLMYYEDLIENCKIIREKFPSELLPFVFSRRPECLATVTSTGIRTIKDQFQEVVTFNYEFSYYEKEFYSLHRYFSAVRIFEKYFCSSMKLFFAGVNRTIVDNMKLSCEYKILDSSEKLREISGNSFVVCDKLGKLDVQPFDLCGIIDQKTKDSVFLFLNSSQDFIFYDYRCKKIWDYIHPVEIRKSKKREYDVYENIKAETIYFFYKGVTDMKPLKYGLSNTGVDVTVDGFKGDKLRIKVLEGLLEATEQRLMQYIEAEKEQQKGEKEEEKDIIG